MKYQEHFENGINVIEIVDKNLIIKSAQDFLDMIGNLPSPNIALHKENLAEEFFDLKTGLAGEILQKASNYQIKFGIIGDFSPYQSKSLKDFIYESNKRGQIVFLNTVHQVMRVFSKK